MKKIKDFILRRLGILKLRKRCTDLETANKELVKVNNANQKKLKEFEKKFRAQEKMNIKLMQRLDGLEEFAFVHHKGLNEGERNPRIIVSLTSFPQRISYLPVSLMRVFAQTLKPDKVILWLSKDQFPNLEKDLPEELLEFVDYGLEIEWCDGDTKAYKKSLPAFEKYPDDLIVILDDDLIYRLDHIEKLYETHKKFPDAIIASRGHKIIFNEDGKIASYKKWKREYQYEHYQMKDDWFFTGGAGTLFPPNIFGPEIFNYDVIQELCPYADDIWLNINAAISNVPIVCIGTNNHITDIEGTKVTRLWDVNKEQNDVQLEKVVFHYHERLRGTIYNKEGY